MTTEPFGETVNAEHAPDAAEHGLLVRDLFKSYGKEPVLSGVSFSLLPGRALGISGSNGAGKTTLLNLLASVLQPDRGLITLFGIPAGRSRAYRQKIGLVPQEIALSARLTVRQNLEFWSAAAGMKGKVRDKAVEDAVRLTNIGAFENKRVSRCSGGMCRRANLAAGLAANPSLILLDEPTAGIDEENRDAILRSIADLKKERRMVIMVNHYHNEMETICDRIITLRDGQMSEGAAITPRMC